MPKGDIGNSINRFIKTIIMKTFINQSTLVSKKNSFFSTFQNNKRIRWTDLKNENQLSFT